jgi:hypothetical protein
MWGRALIIARCKARARAIRIDANKSMFLRQHAAVDAPASDQRTVMGMGWIRIA